MLLALALLIESPQAIVRDIRPAPPIRSASIVRRESVAMGALVCMVLDDLQHGAEPWVSDGTPGGTRLLCDVQPGAASSNPTGLSVVAGRLYFWAERFGSGREPWTSDGTPAGTRILAELVPGMNGSAPATMLDVGGVAYFLNGAMYRTDGTAAGTVVVHALPPYYYAPVVAGGRIYFAGGPASTELELWVSDTTSAHQVLDINPSGGALAPTMRWSVLGTDVLFSAYEPTNGAELWRSDGTAAGTGLVRDVRPGASASSVQSLTSSSGSVYFTADDGVSGREVWISDGTAAGTRLLGDAVPGAGSGSPSELTAIPGGIVFALTTPAWGTELWSGTPAGVQLLVDILPGPASSSPNSLLRFGSRALFGATDSALDAELWMTDGTAAGTGRVADLNLQSSSQPRPFVAAATYALVEANDGVTGREIVRTDGTAPNTLHLGNIATTPGESSSPTALDRVDQALVMSTTLATFGTSVWFSQADGTNAIQLADVPPTSGSEWKSPAVPFGGRLFFPVRLSSTGEEPWVTDTTPAGTALFSDLTPGTGGMVKGMAATRRFLAIGTDTQLHVSDGTPAGTRAIIPPQGMTPFGRFVATDRLVFFAAREPITLFEVWRSDGTDAGTFLLRDIHQGISFSVPSELVVVGDRLFFVQSSPGIGSEVWVSDGTTAGTQLLDVNPTGSSSPKALCAGAGRCFFHADDGVNGRELWSSDGTVAGTTLVADLVPGPGSAVFWAVTGFAGGAFFFFDDGVHGFEPWVSDGTAAGTRMLGDLCPGPASSMVDLATVLTGGGEYVVFDAADVEHGTELWLTDGSPAGTRRLTDLRPGPASMHPFPLWCAGSRLWFSARDDRGREPWSMDLRSEGVAIVETYGRSCDGAGLVPRMRVGRAPHVGRPVDIAMDGGPANAPGVLLFGVGPARIPLDASGACLLLVSGVAATLPVSTSSGGAVAVAPGVPLDPGLVGLILTQQFALAQLGGPIFGAAIATDGLWMLIGR